MRMIVCQAGSLREKVEELEDTLDKEANSLREKVSFLRMRRAPVESPTYERRLEDVEDQLRQVRAKIRELKSRELLT